MIDTRTCRPWTLVTGATGFVGHHVLADLLRDGVRCMAMLRSPDTSVPNLERLLREIGLDAGAMRASGLLSIVEGELPDALPAGPGRSIGRVVHAAGCTRFDTDDQGDPGRTNAIGTHRLLEWCVRNDIREFHLVSTAFVCGSVDRPAREAFETRAPRFHNAYERSKWNAERSAHRWGRHPDRSMTVYRPSIVVGAFGTGRATAFSGPYLSLRASQAVRTMVERDARRRRQMPLRVEGCDTDPLDIVPVDYVASMIAAIVRRGRLHGRTYHLVHPSAPSMKQFRETVERSFDLSTRFVDTEEFDQAPPNDLERSLYTIMRPIRPYMVDPPCFDRTIVEEVETALGVTCPAWDRDALERLVRYAEEARWGRRVPACRRDGGDCAAYFERFLPDHVPQSNIARMASLTTVARFEIEDVPDGQWVCRFERGRLAEVRRGRNGLAERFSYRIGEDAFWEVVAGRTDPQAVFLDGRAEIDGDMEQALKMGAILRAFNEEHPCDRMTLASADGGAADV